LKTRSQGGKWYFDDMQEWPDSLQVTYEFPRSQGLATKAETGLILSYEMRLWAPYPYHDEKDGAVLYGDQGYIVLAVNRWRAYDGDNNLVGGSQCSSDATPHIRNFLDCVKSRRRPNSDLETVGRPASFLCHAGNVAWRVGRTLRIESATEMFEDEEANSLRARANYRAPWKLPDV
jgi:hypothetical protein